METFAPRRVLDILTETSMHRHVDLFHPYIDILAGAGWGRGAWTTGHDILTAVRDAARLFRREEYPCM